MNNAIAHPHSATGRAESLSRKAPNDRAAGNAELRGAIKCLTQLGGEPRFHLAREFAPACEPGFGDLEALDAEDPPGLERVLALGRRLQTLQGKRRQRVTAGGPPSP